MNTANLAELQEAFPEVDAGLRPFGDRVLVQLRTPKGKSAGGIVLVNETKETEKWNIQVGKVRALGPTAFKNQDTLVPWLEGDWCKPGDFIRVPKYGGDRWVVPIPGRKTRDDEDCAMFVIFKSLDLIGQVTVDPLSVIAFI